MEDGTGTIARVLSSYDLGRRIRALRMRKKIALVDLGKHTGLSASLLSQVENGKITPTLGTLTRIAMVFDVGLDYFFSKTQKHLFHLTRAAERMRFAEPPEAPQPDFFFECLAFGQEGKSLQAYLAEFPCREPGGDHTHRHEGAEFLFVIAGRLCVVYQGEEQILETGDSAYFDASEMHSYRGLTGEITRAIVVTTLPRL